jgi:hypothetical protein
MTKNRLALAIGTLVFLPLAQVSSRTLASPCYPNDPDGENLGNLCLSYPPALLPDQPSWMPIPVQPIWSPLPNRPIDQPPFIQGTGKEAYYGYPVSPTQPGRIIGTTTGYWSKVEAVDGTTTTITDSNGKTITSP